MQDYDPKLIEYYSLSDHAGELKNFTFEELNFLDRINRIVNGPESLNGVMDLMFTASLEVCPCERMSLAFFEEDGLRLISYSVKTRYQPVALAEGYAEEIKGNSLRSIITFNRARIINNLEIYLKMHPESVTTQLLIQEGIRSNMVCPLTLEGRVIGLLFRSSRRINAFTKKQVMLHVAISENLSHAIEKAYRFEQLTAANKAYSEMLGFVSHELKNPIASIVLKSQMLMDGYYGNLSAKQRREIEKMIQKGDYLLRLVREYLDLARIEEHNLKINLTHNIDLMRDVIEPSIEMVSPQFDEMKMQLIRFIPSKQILMECDPDLLKIVMINLLGNAAKYGSNEGEIRLRIEPGESGLYISVWNSGPGFAENEKSKLFRKFSRLQSPSAQQHVQSTGVGLYTVKRIIQLHRGKIRARSEEGQWAEFQFYIPQPIDLPEIDKMQASPPLDFVDLLSLD